MKAWRRYLRFLSAISGVLSTIAVIIGIYSFVISQKYRSHDIAFEVVPKLYEKYYEMNRIQLERPYLAHMLVTPDRYPEVARASSTMTEGVTERETAKYWLEERAVANMIWTYYEQLLFQWNFTRDDERKFVVSVLDYFEDSILRNPRLLWWWTIRGGGLETSYEDITRCEIQRNMLTRLDLARPGTVDPAGPFGYRPPETAPGSGNLRSGKATCKDVPAVRGR